MKRKGNTYIAGGLAALMVFSCVPAGSPATVVNAAANNLALGKTATASHYYGQGNASETQFLPANAVDGDLSTRWASEGDSQYNGSLTVDLGQPTEFNQFQIYFEEGGAATVEDYMIEGSNSADSGFVELYNAPDDLTVQNYFEKVDLKEPQTYQYVRITIDVSGYPSASLREFEIYNVDGSESTPQDPEENVALDGLAIPAAMKQQNLQRTKHLTVTLPPENPAGQAMSEIRRTGYT